MKKSRVALFSYLLFLFLMTGCELVTQTQAPQPEPIDTEIAKSTITLTPNRGQTNLPTLTSMPQLTTTPQPSKTPKLTLTTTPTSTGSKTPTYIQTDNFISTRYPVREQVEQFLQEIIAEKPYDGFGIVMDLLYEDVNGDGENDLVVTGYIFVCIFLWNDTQYTEPYIFTDVPGKYDTGIQVSFGDWTNDNVPEVVFDYRAETGGTGVHHEYWTRRIIHCMVNECKLVWYDTVAALTTQNGIVHTGLELFENDVQVIQTDDGQPLLMQSSHAFMFDSDAWFLGGYLLEPIYKNCQVTADCNLQDVYHTQVKLYQWSGSEFEIIHESITGWPHSFPSFDPTAFYRIDENDYFAKVVVLLDEYPAFPLEQCQLEINDVLVGNPFYCYENYANIEWIDVNGGDRSEIVITVLAGPFDIDWQWITEKECTHEKMIIYQWDGNEVEEIANVDGCVVREDLYGVRLEDINNDGNLEIMAADKWLTDDVCNQFYYCWHELNNIDQVHKWNGQRYEFWQDKARE